MNVFYLFNPSWTALQPSKYTLNHFFVVFRFFDDPEAEEASGSSSNSLTMSKHTP